jgi:prephenate dehydrogenase
VAVIGLGCIGGSLARALVAQGVEVRGWSTSAVDRERAAAAHIDVSADGLHAACAAASMVVLAVPMASMSEVACAVLGAVGRDVLVLHVGALQRREALGVDELTYDRLLGTHPLAGSHDSGFGASRPDLFVGCAVSVEERAEPRARTRAEWLWRTAAAGRIDYRTAEVHDALMTWVSHLPQLTATALAAALAAENVDPRAMGTGVRDATRIAASAFAAWPPLLRSAPRELHDALLRLEEMLANLRQALDDDDEERIMAIWEAGRSWRRRGDAGERERLA